MYYFLLIIVTATASFKALICKRLGTDGGGVRRLLALNSVIFLIATLPVLLSVMLGGGFYLSRYSLGYALVYGATLVFTQLCQITAMRYGTTSMTTLVYSAGFLIPIVFSYFSFGEDITWVQLIGIAVLLCAIYMIVNPKGGFSVRWLIFALMAMCGSGATAVVQKIHQRSEFAGELPSFLAVVFLTAATICFVTHLFMPRAACDERSVSVKTTLFPVVSGLCIGFLNILNLTLAGKLPSVIQFPIYNVGSMILTGVLGAILFKEKNSRTEIIGFGLGCAAILMIGLF